MMATELHEAKTTELEERLAAIGRTISAVAGDTDAKVSLMFRWMEEATAEMGRLSEELRQARAVEELRRIIAG